MLLKLTHAGAVLIVAPSDRQLDAGNARRFRDAMGLILEKHRTVVLDLSSIEFIDSAGVGTLVSCLQAACRHQGHFRLCGLSRPVSALFDLMRMHCVFEIYNNRDEALLGLAA